MDEERLRILRMVEEGRINAQEAADLLEALESRQEREESFGLGAGTAARLHIRITDTDSGRVKTDVVVPMGLLGHKLSRRISKLLGGRGGGPDIAHIAAKAAQRSQRRGTVVDVTDDKRSERVEILIE